MRKKNRRTLVLNNQYMPLSLFPLYTIPAEDAITRYLTDSCNVVEWYPDEIGTVRDLKLQWPSVITNYHGHTFVKDVRLKKESLFYRDHCMCQYCGEPLTISSMTYDHLIPRAAGGKHTWDNVVASCKRCNNQKGDSLSPKWKPRQKPFVPDFFQMVKIRSKFPIVIDDPSWEKFLPNWVGGVTIRNRRDSKIPDTFDVDDPEEVIDTDDDL